MFVAQQDNLFAEMKRAIEEKKERNEDQCRYVYQREKYGAINLVGFSIICWIKWKKISLDTPIIFAYNSSSAVAAATQEEEVVAAAAVEQESVNRYT